MNAQHKRDAHYIGRCPVKGCKSVMHLTVPMQGFEEVRNFGNAQQWTHIRWQPEAGRYYTPHSEGIHCAKHRRHFYWKPIDGRVSEKHVCDARCVNAIGPNCECSCGGKNHGVGHSPEKLFNFNS